MWIGARNRTATAVTLGVLMGALYIGTAVAAPDTTVRVSVSSDGIQGDAASSGAAISADARHIGFHSPASTLVPGDTNRLIDVFVKDRITGAIARVSVSSTGVQGKGQSEHPSLSADGRFVAFHSGADNLTPGDANGNKDVFVHDRDADSDGIFDEPGGIATINITKAAAAGPFGSSFATISASGRFVAFRSGSPNLVEGDTVTCTYPPSGLIASCQDIFVYDRDADGNGIFDEAGATKTVLVSKNDFGEPGNNNSWDGRISADGRYVAFKSTATNLVTGDTRNNWDVFVHDRDPDANGVFDEAGLISTKRASVDSFGKESNGNSQFPAISGDGRYVTFSSNASNLVTGDTNRSPDVFVRDTVNGTTERVSVDSFGEQANGGSSLFTTLSSTGRYVVFESRASNLVTGDTNLKIDIFVHDRELHTTTRVSVDTNGVESNGDSTAPVISGDGLVVAFTSLASNLVDGDTNVVSDVFVRAP